LSLRLLYFCAVGPYAKELLMKKDFGLSTAILLFITLLFPFLGNTQSKDEIGEWGQPIQFGIVPVAVANLPDGRLLTWSSQFRNTFTDVADGATFTQYFDPQGGIDGNGGVDGPEFTSNTDHDMFCPGINNLPDGRILSAGGTTSERTSIFDPMTGTWSVAAEMNIPRGYQGNVTLRDGNVFTIGGSWGGGRFSGTGDRDAEIWSPTTGWITLPNIRASDTFNNNDLNFEEEGLYRVDNHVWLWAAPNGKVFHAGPGERMNWIDVDVPGGEIVDAGLRQDAGVTDTYSMKGNTVMFDTGKILKVGGATQYGRDEETLTPAKSNSFIIDLNGVAYGVDPPVQFAGNMAFERIYQNSTVLPNGDVFVSGGATRAALFSDAYAVLEGEIFTEGQGWRTVAAMNEPRTYHSVAILMPDARVFVGGGGLCDDTPGCDNHFNAEIYSPPYLFDSSENPAFRPNIETFTSGNPVGPYGEIEVDYNSNLGVTTDTNVSEFSLIRFSSATHATNNEQRRISLPTTTGTSHNLSIPDRDLLPPGYYMLFALNEDGVPSIARTLKIGTAIPLASNPNKIIEFNFEETGSGTTVTDSSGNGNNGTVVEREDDGTPRTADDHQFVTGLFGNSIEMDGEEFNSNSIIDIPLSSSIRGIEDKMTISAWVWRDPESIVEEDGNKIANVAVFAYNYDDNFFGFHNSLYKWSFRTDNGFVDVYSGYAPLAGWNHIAATYDGATVRLYANGKEVGLGSITGNIKWDEGPTDDSSVTVSGFYDDRDLPFRPWGNESGITDEVDGRIDEFVVYNVALGDEEIANIYNEGVQLNNPDVPNCNGVSVGDVEYRLNGGPWQDVLFDRITVALGDEVELRAKSFAGQYFITTSLLDGPTFDSTSDLNGANAYQIDTGVFDPNPGDGIIDNDGLIDLNDQGYIVLTTPEGCPKAIMVNVSGLDCTQTGGTLISAEYNVNGTWFVGNAVTLQEGDALRLSIVPNIGDNPEAHPATIILPNGNSVRDGFIIDPVDASHAGRYEFISAQGCTDFLDVTIETVDCNALGLVTEYQINGGAFITGQSSVTVDEGSDLRLSIEPNGTPFSITSNSPNNNNKENNTLDLFLNDVTTNDAGEYVFTTSSGCSVTLDVIVEAADCNDVETEYQINNFGGYVEGASSIMVDEGNLITLSVVPNGISFSITSTSVNGNSKEESTSDLVLSSLTKDDEGIYTFTTNTGCVVTLELLVNEIDCTELGLQTQYDLNGANNFISGAEQVRLAVGESIQLSVVPDFYNGMQLAFSIAGPNGNNKPLNPADLTIDNIQEADEGLYTMISSSGCEVTLLVLVGPNEAPVANATATPLVGDEPLEVTFDASGSTDDAGINSYSWDFGDGAGSSAAVNPTYTYTLVGEYTATLTVVDNEGAQNTTTLTIVVNEGNQAPTAVASATPLTGTVPLEVSFSSVGSTDDVGIVTYTWDFGDGSAASNEENPSHTYTSIGVYTANLTVTDAEGAEDEATIEITVNADAPPTAVILADPLMGQAPLLVQFDGTTSTDDVGIASYAWDFDNGETSNEASPEIQFMVSGNYMVSLTVTDTAGQIDTATLMIVVETPENSAPIASIIADPLSGNAPLEVSFSSQGSTDDKGIVTFAWDFDSGDTSNVENPTYTFTEVGIYEVILTVTDEEGLMDMDTVVITVEAPNEAPTAIASATPTSGLIPLEVAFSSAGSTDDKAIVSYSWDFGDGSTPSTEESPSHTYTISGTFTATLTVEDAEGLQNTATVEIVVESPANEAPIAVADATPTSGLAPLEVAFSSAGSSDDKAIVSYSWDFGDGSTPSTEESPSHTYTTSGSFTATLTVADAEGLTDSASVVINVETPDNQAPNALATASPLTGTAPLQVEFNANGSSDDNGVVSYTWDFGDGTSSTEKNPNYTYTDVGTYIVVLTVADAQGLEDTDTVTIVVEASENVEPSAQISVDEVTGIAPLEVEFSSEGSMDDVEIVSYAWDFGNGDSSTDANPTYTFTAPGSYTVRLTVTDNEGLTGEATVTITVTAENQTESVEEAQLTIAPNPASGNYAELYVTLPNDRFITRMGFHDATGRLIFTYLPSDIFESQGYYRIPIGTVRNGLYYLRVTYNKGEAGAVRILVRN